MTTNVNTQPRRELHPDVYDALELSAMVHGGIGGGSWARATDPNDSTTLSGVVAGFPEGYSAPCCVEGHGLFVEAPEGVCESGQEIFEALGRVFPEGAVSVNDELFNGKFFSDNLYQNRKLIPFATWCKRLNVVRADVPTFDPANFEEPVYVTIEMLEEKSACQTDRDGFKKLFGDKAQVTVANVAHAKVFGLSLCWVRDNLIGDYKVACECGAWDTGPFDIEKFTAALKKALTK